MLKWLISMQIFLGICYSLEQIKILHDIQKGVEHLKTSNDVPQYLNDTIKFLRSLNESDGTEAVCESCAKIFQAILSYRRHGANKGSMIGYLKKLCKLFTDWGDIGCEGYVDIEIDTVLFVIDSRAELTPERICAIQLQDKKCEDPDATKWSIPLPPFPDEDTGARNDTSTMYTILHLTDIHYDPLYVPGSAAKCDEPLCCQTGEPTNKTDSAGYWGDYHVCDMPWHSVEDLMKRVKEKHKHVDFVYFTGDIISHRSWNTSIQANTESIQQINNIFVETFGSKKVFPILGNHEPHPTDFYSPENITDSSISTRWLFNLIAKQWSRWLPKDTKNSILKGGYYTVVVRPGFRIIGLNSNVCFTSNLWLIYNDVDPNGQLKWLVNILTIAEKNKEKVHILSHIPPGEILCHKRWSHVFQTIVNRFATTISAQFNGHTHLDEFRVFYNESNQNEAINVAYNGGSFTTYIGFNPNYRIYQVDGNSLFVTNYDQYMYDLGKANDNPELPPKWFKLYSFRDAYQLDDLSLTSISELLTKMGTDFSIVKKYYNYMIRDNTGESKCDEDCSKKLVCLIKAVCTENSVNC